MKYIKYFEELSQYETFKNSAKYILPNASYIAGIGGRFEPYIPGTSPKITAFLNAPAGSLCLRKSIPNLKTLKIDGQFVELEKLGGTITIISCEANKFQTAEDGSVLFPADYIYAGTIPSASWKLSPKSNNIKITDCSGVIIMLYVNNAPSAEYFPLDDLVTAGLGIVDEENNCILINTSSLVIENTQIPCGFCLANMQNDESISYIDSENTIDGTVHSATFDVRTEHFGEFSVSDEVFETDFISNDVLKLEGQPYHWIINLTDADSFEGLSLGVYAQVLTEEGFRNAVVPLVDLYGEGFQDHIDAGFFYQWSSTTILLGTDLLEAFGDEIGGFCVLSWNHDSEAPVLHSIINSKQTVYSVVHETFEVDILASNMQIEVLEEITATNQIKVTANQEWTFSGSVPLQMSITPVNGVNIDAETWGIAIVEKIGSEEFSLVTSVQYLIDEGSAVLSNNILSITIPEDEEGTTEEIFSSGGYIGMMFCTIDSESQTITPIDTKFTVHYSALNLPKFETSGDHTIELELTDDIFLGGLPLIESSVYFENIRIIGNNAFEDANLKYIDFGNNLQIIQSYAFAYTHASKITLPNTITTMGTDIFKYSRIPYIKIEHGLTSIGEYMFANSEVEEVELPDSVTSIGSYAFDRCINLSSIHIPDSVTSMGNYIFRECSNLKSVYIGNGITTWSSYYFTDAENIETITVGSNNPVYDSRNNCNCVIDTATNKIIFGGGSAIIPETVTGIASMAFINNKMRELHIPAATVDIATTAIYCPNLETISVASENPIFDSRNNCNAIVETNTNSIFKGCKTTTFPENVTAIGERAFMYVVFDDDLVIPDHIITIGNTAFYDCTAPAVHFGTGLISLDVSAFESANTTQIWSYSTIAPSIYSSTFMYITSNGVLHYPSDSTGYETWLSTEKDYLGYNGWTGMTF